MKDVEEISGGTVRLATGTLYGALDRLAASDLIRVVKQELVAGRSRRYYSITAQGLAVLEAETGRWLRTAQIAQDRLRLGDIASATGGGQR